MARSDFDTQAFFAALDAQRKAKKFTWKQVEEETGVSASTLVRIAQERLPDVKNFVVLMMWLGLPLEAFWHGGEKKSAETLATISSCLHADPCLQGEDANYIDELVRSAYLKHCKH